MKCLTLFSLAYLFLITLDSIAQPILIEDHNTKPAGFYRNMYSNPYMPGKDYLYLVSDGQDKFGSELWRTNGTADGTFRLTDIVPGRDNSLLMVGADLNGTFLFATVSPKSELWKTDGSLGGTQKVASLVADGRPLTLSNISNLNNTIVFVAVDSDYNTYVGVSNGTSEGTQIVKKLDLGPSSTPFFGSMTIFQTPNYLYLKIATNDNVAGKLVDQLWRTDGTESGTIFIAAEQDLLSSLATVGNDAYFLKGNNKLWKTDGTSQGTSFVYEFTGWNNPKLYPYNDKVIITGFKTWISNGTPGGTSQITDAVGVFFGTNVLNGKFYAIKDDLSGDPNRTLYVTDGTVAGTAEFNLGDATLSASGGRLPIVGNKLIVPFGTIEHGVELGTWDENSHAVVLLKDINPGTQGSSSWGYRSFKDKLYFFADDGVHGTEMWVSDLTEGGTHMIRDVIRKTDNATGLASRVYNTSGGKLALAQGEVGSDLFKMNDNPPGLSMYKNGLALNGMGVSNGKLFYHEPTQVWMTDGADGDVLLKDYVGASSTQFNWTGTNIIQIGSKYLTGISTFGSATEKFGMELWITDGTLAGSGHLKDINPGTGDGLGFGQLAKLSETLVLFSGNDGATGFELWKTDGTSTGTVLLKELRTGPSGSQPAEFFVDGGVAYFSADDGSGRELWRSDGTDAGTYLIKDINPAGSSKPKLFTKLGDNIYFFAVAENKGWTLWKTDGTEAGTSYVADTDPSVLDENPPFFLTESNGLLYFQAYDPDHGSELWVSDGTAAGTNYIDIVPGPVGSLPLGFVKVNGGVYFSANDQIWKSPGQAKFTTKVADIDVSLFTEIDGVLYFSGDSDYYGVEYFKLTPEKFDQEITFTEIQTVPVGTTSINLTATASTGLPVSFSSNSNAVTIVGNTATVNKPGKVTITATQSGNGGFKSAEASRTFCITPGTPQITLASSSSIEPLLQSSYDGQNQWYLDGAELAGQTGKQLTAKKAGTYTVKAIVEGCGSTTSSTYVLPKQNQTITFALSDHNVSEASFPLTATSNSGLAITYTTDPAGRVTISGSTATIVAPGKVKVIATQAGNDLFVSASKDQTICITPAKPTVTQSGNVTLTSSAAAGNEWLLSGAPVAGATSQSFKPVVDGSYSVRVVVDGCVSPTSDAVNVVIVGIEDVSNGIVIYPNPVRDILYVNSGTLTRLDIVNSLGQTTEQHTFNGSLELSLSSYAKGIYLLKVSTNESTVLRRIVKE